MTRSMALGFGLAMLLLVFLVGCAAPTVRPTQLDALAAGTGGGLALTWPTGSGPAVDNYVVKPDEVVSVYDGDTFYIRVPSCADELPALCGKLGVRIDGVDTPERRGKCAAESGAALRARSLVVERLGAAREILLVGVRREKYGRLLTRVQVDGVDLGAELVLAGLARPYHGEKRVGWCAGEEAGHD